MSRRKKQLPTPTGVSFLFRFLLGYVRPHWRLLLTALAVTAVYAGLNAARAPLAGLFTGKVFLREMVDERAPDAAAASRVEPAAQPAAAGAVEAAGAGGASPQPAADGAEKIKEHVRGWAERHLPLVSRVRERWRQMQERWSWRQWLYLCAGLLAGIALLMAVANVARILLQEALVLRVLIAIRVHVASHLLGLSLRYFSRHKLGDLYSRLTNDIGQTHSALVYLFVDVFEAVLLILAYASVCLYTSWKLSLSALVIAPPIFIVMRLFGRKIRRRSRGRQISQAEVTEEMQQMLTGVRIVKAFDNEAMQVARFERANLTFFRRALRVIRVKAMSRGFVEVLNHWAIALLMIVGVYFVLDVNMVSRDDLVTFIGAVALMYQPAKKMVRAFNNIADALAAVDRLQEVLDEQPDVTDRPDALELETVRGELCLEGVCFAYDSEPVLHDVAIEARPGEVVALVGESGAGKSTLVDLLARLYDPDQGRIMVDGHDLRDVRRSSYMRHVAVVTQDPFLFNDSVSVNLRYAKPDASDAELEAACRAANIHEAIASLDEGYDTLLGERGATLSGGQRQRLTIARALLKDPRILLLDEATSALDSESERLVQQALDRLMEGRTTVVVAHRLSTITRADRIVVLESGRVIEQGSHEELVALGGRYARFHALQTDTPERAGAGEDG